MEKKRVVPVWVSVVLVVLAIGGIVWSIAAGTQDPGGFKYTEILVYICTLAALLYCVTGYKKNSALFFKIFCIAYTVTKAVPILTAENNTITMFHKLILLIAFGAMCILTVAKDLGKTKSYILAGIVVACSISELFFNLGKAPDMEAPLNAEAPMEAVAGAGISMNIASSLLNIIVISVILGIMIYAKYKDKEARGTK